MRSKHYLLSSPSQRHNSRVFSLLFRQKARGAVAAEPPKLENMTGEGPVKRQRQEVAVVNNQGNSLPRKKFYRARAHCNPLSDSQFPVCVITTTLRFSAAAAAAHTARAQASAAAHRGSMSSMRRLRPSPVIPSPPSRCFSPSRRAFVTRPFSSRAGLCVPTRTTGSRTTRRRSPRPRQRTSRNHSFESRTSDAVSAVSSCGFPHCFPTASP